MIRSTAVVAAVAASVAACGSSQPHGGGAGSESDRCVARVLAAEAGDQPGASALINVAITPELAVWQVFKSGALRVHPLLGDGPTRTLVPPSTAPGDGHDLLVHADYAYYTTQAGHAVDRVPLAGGPPEQLIDTGDDEPVRLARVGDTIYAGTHGKKVFWWSLDGGAKSIVGSQDDQALGGRDDQLYLGREFDVAATLDLAHVEPHQVAATDQRAYGVAVTASMVYWLEAGDREPALMRQGRSGGDVLRVAVPVPGIQTVVAADRGVYVAADTAVLWVDDTMAVAVEVARLPGETITDIAVDGDTVVAGTIDGKVHQLCAAPQVSGPPAPASPGT